MAQSGLIPRKFKDCRVPVCASCQHGKQHKKPWRVKSSDPSPIGGKEIKQPGDCVSVDQLKSSTPGLIGQVKGWLTKERQHIATVFVDHYSDLTYVHITPSDTSMETVAAKEAFERFAASHNVTVKHYHADNGRFADNLFKQHVIDKGQTISYCGVGAHHQNGKVERRIRDIVDQARTMLLHAAHRWPDAVSATLWPYALLHAVRIRNHMSTMSKGETPMSIFSGSEVKGNVFWKHQHTFGCPAFVLDAPLQGSLGGKPKWSERSRIGVFLGHSSQHSSTVAMILNPKTGHVSCQFHVVFDDRFETVKQGANIESLWEQKAGIPDQLSESISVEIPHQRFNQDWVMEPLEPEPIPITSPPSESTNVDHQTNNPQTKTIVKDDETPQSPSEPAQSEGAPQVSRTDHSNQPRRSKRLAKHKSNKPRRSPRIASHVHPYLVRAHFVRLGISTEREDGTIDDIHPLIHAFASSASTGDPDTMHLGDARKQPDWHKFKEAMDKEVGDFNSRKHWELVPATILDELKEKGIKFDVIQAIWSFKRKRTPSGDLLKYKSRLCAHGGQQTSNTYWETFSPVVQWTTLRTILTLSLIRNWKARSIDFVLAFPQAEMKSNVFMKIPYGYQVDKPGQWLLKLVKNVYGVKDASRTWAIHLKEGLLARKFTQSKVDPCVFFKGNLILVIYVDDLIAFCPEDKPIDDFIESMKQAKPQSYILEDQGDLKDYLGIEIVREGDQIHITQKHLIQKIISQVNFKDERVNTVETPASGILFKNESAPDIDPKDAPFNYRSVIGSMNYLAQTTRPDISMAVHQCARFCANPKAVHYTAVKRIVRYLIGTSDKGMTLNVQEPILECFADADFAGSWDRTDPLDPENVKSRSGHIIKFAGCPIHWGSKLQDLVSLSTVESEYISLSYATRQVLFILHLLEELKENKIDFELPIANVYAKCFEDNTGCLDLAKTPKLRPRTKHIAVKYHHFRSHVRSKENPTGILELHWVSTDKQQADIFTKPLPPKTFLALRRLICGW